MPQSSSIQQATTLTARDLSTVARSGSLRELSHLTLPEINSVVDLVSQIVPAGNVPGMIVSGLSRLPGQRLPPQTLQQHVNALFSGVEQILDKVTFSTVFAGPAAVIWGYQNLLKLAGKDPNAAFPEGVWQFYVDYALREDTARHVNETHGFDTLLREHDIRLSKVDRLTAWVMAAISCIHQYDALLEEEWRERVSTSILQELVDSLDNADNYAGLYRKWEIQRPYRRGAEAASYDYPDYRRIKFEHFLHEIIEDLPSTVRAEWAGKMQVAEKELPDYKRQMSILAYLEPGNYGETRVSYDFEQAQIGLIAHGEYFLLPVYSPGTDQPLDAETVRAQVTGLLTRPGGQPANLTDLPGIRRSSLAALRNKLSPSAREGLEKLRFAPIIINADQRPSNLPLTELRQAERGVGDHALTIFETNSTFVFDQSHIFFDGILGSALAEIMTNEALSWAVYLNTLPPSKAAQKNLFLPLNFNLTSADRKLVQSAQKVTPEAGAETEKINLRACLKLRYLFKRRSDMLHLTVNDLLVLYRAMHAAHYQPSPKLASELQLLASEPATRPLAVKIATMLDKSRRQNPSMLIPMDASRNSPRDRLYPLSMEVPLVELDLLNLHRMAVHALEAYAGTGGERSTQYQAFDKAQRAYLAALAGFGMIFAKFKEIAIRGESASVGAIKLLAHLPPALQRLLDKLPSRVEMLNNMIKGQEVFSNVGAVVPTSTLKRFVTAKDDNEQKQLVWGIITDANGVMRISLRDFRPHVAELKAIGRYDLAQRITQDYLDAYAEGFNAFVHDLQRITVSSRETRLAQHAPTIVARKNM